MENNEEVLEIVIERVLDESKNEKVQNNNGKKVTRETNYTDS